MPRSRLLAAANLRSAIPTCETALDGITVTRIRCSVGALLADQKGTYGATDCAGHPLGRRQPVRSMMVNPNFLRLLRLGDPGAAVAVAKETPRSAASRSRYARSAG